MNDTTRRAFLKGAGAVTAGAAVSIPAIASVGPDHPDAELLALERQLLDIDAKLNTRGLLSDDEADVVIEKHSAIERRIAAAPAHTPEGIAVKVRRMQAEMLVETDYDRDNFRTVLEALSRIAGRAGS